MILFSNWSHSSLSEALISILLSASNSDAVTIDKNLDFKLTSNELNGNLEKGEFYSTKPIYFNINSGFLKSENFFYNQNDKKVIFLGRTKLVFFK